jgi:hypothetical protein
LIKEALGISMIKIETIAVPERVRKKIDYRITLRRRLVIASREIDQHLPHRIGASFIVGDIFRSHFSGYDLAFCRSGKGRKHAQKTNCESEPEN